MKKKKIQAVHDDDLNKILEDLGMINDYRDGNLKCVFCNESINEDNLYSILPRGNEINFSCDKQECINKITNI